MRRNFLKRLASRNDPLKVLFLAVSLLSIAAMACNFSFGGDKNTSQGSPTQDDSQLVAQSVQLTLDALQPTQAPTIPPSPTAEPTEAAEVALPPTLEIPQDTATPEAPDIESQIQNARILLYEDIGAEGLKRYVKEALDRGGYDYYDVAGEIKPFKNELVNGDYDLIIAATESRSHVRGEFFDYMNDALNRGSSVILEIWYLDEVIRGKVSSLMDRCSFRLFKDWLDPDKDSRSIFWLQPDHPLLTYPNSDISLIHYGPYWTGDAGDFLMSMSGSGGELVAGNVSFRKSDYGTIGVCDEGRFIIQTFSTHDYKSAEVIKLWENYIYYALKSHFEAMNNS